MNSDDWVFCNQAILSTGTKILHGEFLKIKVRMTPRPRKKPTLELRSLGPWWNEENSAGTIVAGICKNEILPMSGMFLISTAGPPFFTQSGEIMNAERVPVSLKVEKSDVCDVIKNHRKYSF